MTEWFTPFISRPMPRATTDTNHPGSATKTTKKVTIKNGSGIPTIEERLGLSIDHLHPLFSSFQGYLRPSRELLEFYRRKIAQYDNERDEILQKLDRCKVAYEEKVRLFSSKIFLGMSIILLA